MKWKILYALVNLTAGTGSGTRQINVVYGPYNQGSSGVPYGLYLINSSTSTGSLISQGGIISVGNTGSTIWNGYPILQHTGVIAFDLTLISGDTFSYTILVDEEADF